MLGHKNLMTPAAAFAAFLGLALLSSCAPPGYQADSQAATRMSLEEAKDVIQRGDRWYWADGATDHDAGSWEFTVDHIEAYTYRRDGSKAKNASCPYETFNPVYNAGAGDIVNGAHKGSPSFFVLTQSAPDECAFNFVVPTKEMAEQATNALLRWKQSTPAERQAYFSGQRQRFAPIAETYRNANPKPKISEDVRRLQVAGDVAVNEKRFGDAANSYEDALKLAPWWPEGQFNAAVIMASIHYYDEAIEHMQNYLALVPGVSNARAAQDHIYAWEGELRSIQ